MNDIEGPEDEFDITQTVTSSSEYRPIIRTVTKSAELVTNAMVTQHGPMVFSGDVKSKKEAAQISIIFSGIVRGKLSPEEAAKVATEQSEKVESARRYAQSQRYAAKT